MYKDSSGKWVNGSAAKAKYHIQVRSNSKMMEMTSHYLNEFCGDGTPPHETVMTARAKVNKNSGKLESPKKTTVKKYSFTYAMAFERLSQGKGLVSRYDRQTQTMLDELIGLARKTLLMATDDKTIEFVQDWQDKLREVFDYIEKGQTPIYLTDLLGCWPEQLQTAMKILYNKQPEEEWRIDLRKIIKVLVENDLVENEYPIYMEFGKKKDERRDMWRERGRLELDSRYNIRTSTRFPADNYNSETVRGWLEWIFDVPSCTKEKDRKDIAHDIKILTKFIQEARLYQRTKRGKEEVGMKLKLALNELTTCSESSLNILSKE